MVAELDLSGIYADARGLRASRQVEQACYDDVGFRVVAGNQQPDFWTLAAFRRRHREALGDLLTESIRLATAAGLVRLRDVAVDGTKVQAAASKHRAMSYARMQEREAELAQEVQRYLDAVEAADTADDAEHGPNDRGWTVPPGLADAQKRLATIRAAKARLEAEARDRAEAKQAEREAAADAAGKPRPEPPADSPTPDPKAQSNFTDPDSRIMRNGDKAFIQGYNAQIAVDAETQVIVAADVTNQAADSPHLLPMVDQVVANTGRRPQGVLADAGYWSEDNRHGVTERTMEAIVPPEKLRHREWRTAQALWRYHGAYCETSGDPRARRSSGMSNGMSRMDARPTWHTSRRCGTSPTLWSMAFNHLQRLSQRSWASWRPD